MSFKYLGIIINRSSKDLSLDVREVGNIIRRHSLTVERNSLWPNCRRRNNLEEVCCGQKHSGGTFQKVCKKNMTMVVVVTTIGSSLTNYFTDN